MARLKKVELKPVGTALHIGAALGNPAAGAGFRRGHTPVAIS
jgi:hypothetical protein